MRELDTINMITKWNIFYLKLKAIPNVKVS